MKIDFLTLYSKLQWQHGTDQRKCNHLNVTLDGHKVYSIGITKGMSLETGYSVVFSDGFHEPEVYWGKPPFLDLSK